MKIPPFKLLILIFLTLIIGSCSNEDFLPIEELSTRSADIEKISPEDFYPTVTEIIADPTVKAAMDSAWIETLSLANKNGRQEIGFYIYYDFDKKEYEIGEKKYGPIIPNEENTYGSLYWVVSKII